MPDRKPTGRKDGKEAASSEEQADVATELASIKTMLQGIATDIGGVKASLTCLQAMVQRLGESQRPKLTSPTWKTNVTRGRKQLAKLRKLWNNFRRESTIWRTQATGKT